MASYARSWQRFEEAGLQVVGVSVDSQSQNQAMIEKLVLPFPLLSDSESRVIREWGVLNTAEKDIAKPAVFLVRPDLSISISYVGEDFEDRPEDDLIFAGVG